MYGNTIQDNMTGRSIKGFIFQFAKARAVNGVCKGYREISSYEKVSATAT